jgi:HK97 gp10 family phage protein
MARVQLSGFKDLEEELGRLSKAVARNALTRAGTKALEPMARAARRLAPVDEGDLQESIDVGARVSNDVGRAAFASVLQGGGTQAEAVAALRSARRAASAEAPFVELYMGPAAARNRNEAIKAIAQEFGTSFHGPHPYMRPAFDAEAMPTLDRLKRELWEEVQKAVARAERKAARAAARAASGG